MREFEIEVATADGSLDMFVCHPEEGGPFPAIIMYMDAPGIREELRDMARRIGTVGYFVVFRGWCRPTKNPGYGNHEEES